MKQCGHCDYHRCVLTPEECGVEKIGNPNRPNISEATVRVRLLAATACVQPESIHYGLRRPTEARACPCYSNALFDGVDPDTVRSEGPYTVYDFLSKEAMDSRLKEIEAAVTAYRKHRYSPDIKDIPVEYRYGLENPTYWF